MAFGQMGWTPMYGSGFMGNAMPDQLAQLRAQQQFAPPMQPQQSAQGAPIWVQGEAGAKSFLVGPGQSVMLMDSERDVFYIKASDQAGMPLPLRTFDYKERASGAQKPVQAAQNPGDQYVTRAEYDALAAKLAAVTAKLETVFAPPQTSSPEPARENTRRRGLREESEIDA